MSKKLVLAFESTMLRAYINTLDRTLTINDGYSQVLMQEYQARDLAKWILNNTKETINETQT